MPIAIPSGQVPKDWIKFVGHDQDARLANKGLYQRVEFLGNLCQRIPAIVEHVVALLQFRRIARVDVEDGELLFDGDLSDEVVDFFTGLFA